MIIESFAARDFVAPDLLPPDLVDATAPGSLQLVKGAAPAPVAVLLEFDFVTVS